MGSIKALSRKELSIRVPVHGYTEKGCERFPTPEWHPAGSRNPVEVYTHLFDLQGTDSVAALLLQRQSLPAEVVQELRLRFGRRVVGRVGRQAAV